MLLIPNELTKDDVTFGCRIGIITRKSDIQKKERRLKIRIEGLLYFNFTDLFEIACSVFAIYVLKAS